MNGTIKKKTDRGFGFISQPGKSDDLFFHGNDLVGISYNELDEGTEVTFDVERGHKGLAAKNVKLADSTDDAQDTQASDTEESESSDGEETEETK